MWDELMRGALVAVVLVDTRRLADSFAPIDFFESRGLPYIVALNIFDGTQRYALEEVAEALAIPARIPILECDARHRDSTKQVLIKSVEHAITALREENPEIVPTR
jgi:signal recognition particle receptor subunit beta